MAVQKVAIITGGASGIGLAVAQALAARGGWAIHLLDLNVESGESVAASLSSIDSVTATFHRCDAASYEQMGAAFRDAFRASGRRLDFVFANAGFTERAKFYDKHEAQGDDVPPPPDMLVLRVVLDGVINATHLALHYFRLSPKDADQSVVMTSSCMALYAGHLFPIYCAAKSGIVAFMRAASKNMFVLDGVRINAICPSIVKTGILTEKEWSIYPEELFNPLENVVGAVLMLLDNNDTAPAEKTRIDGVVPEKRGVLWGETVELSGDHYYFREGRDFCDEKMAKVMKGTDLVELPGGQEEASTRTGIHQ